MALHLCGVHAQPQEIWIRLYSSISSSPFPWFLPFTTPAQFSVPYANRILLLILCFTTGHTTTIKVQLMNMNWLPNMPMGFSFRVVYDGSGSLYMSRESYEFRTFWTFFRIIGRGHNLSPFAIPLLLKSKSNCLGESKSLSLTGIFISWKDTIYIVNRDTAFIFE